MQNLTDRLHILHTTNDSTYTDHSQESFDFLQDEFTISKTILVGFRKPLNSIYIRVKTPSETPGSFTYSYWDGSTWTSMDVLDEARSLTRSGHIQWARELENEATKTINGITAYWYRLDQSVAENVTLWGIGGLLCSDQSLQIEYPSITHTSFYERYPAGTDTHIYSLVSARDTICSQLNISVWDLLNLPEISTAASFLALSKIFNSVSDREDDKYSILSQSYHEQYRALKSRLMITIDRNDNGKEDTGEKSSQSVVRFSR
ncbi:MAG: hypothetical protein ACOH5I_21900 [Oligoflexus sp.]